MATTTVSDAIVVPQSQGTGLPSEDDPNSAAAVSLMSQHVGGEYVVEDFGDGMAFVARDATNDTITIGTGACYITDTSSSTANSRGAGGNAQLQSTSSSGYDTEIPDNQTYLVMFPSQVTIGVDDATTNQIWVNITDVTSNNAVEVRSDSGTTAAPADTFIKLGEANADDASQDIRSSDRPTLSPREVGGVKVASPGEIQEKIDEFASAGTNGTVVLEPNKVYDPASTVEVKPNIILDGQRASIEPSTDQMIFDVHPHGALRNITVDISVNFSAWTSTVIRCSADSGAGGSWAGRYPVIENATLLGNQTSYPPGGTFIKIQSTANGHLTFLDFRGIHTMTTESDGLSGVNLAIGTGIHLEDNGSFLNSMVFDQVILAGCDVGILQDGTGSTNNGHRFTNVLVQPEEGSNTAGDESAIGWDIQLGGNNYLSGYFWDNTNWQTASVRTGSGAGDGNTIESENALGIRNAHSKANNKHLVYKGGEFEGGEDVATNNETARAEPFETHVCTANNSITTVQLPEGPEMGTEVYVSARNLTNECRVETTDGEAIEGATSIDASTDRFTLNTLDEAYTFRWMDSFGWVPDKAD